MNIGFVTRSISRESGGLFFSVRSLSKELETREEIEVNVFGIEDAHSRQDVEQWHPVRPEISCITGPASLGFSLQLSKALHAAPCDLLHTQGIWQGPSWAVHGWHRKTRKPYLVSPRGMLDPWALANSRWKKRIAAALYENDHLRGAACLHALCESEARSMRGYGLKNPVCVIPNGVELPTMGGQKPEKRDQKKVLLFLGRLHPKKGLANALRAWKAESGRRKAEWRLVIAGWDQGGHEAELKALATELGIRWMDGEERHGAGWRGDEPSVVFAGPAFGEAKDRLLREADAFILPSFSEGLPMAVLEAWAWGLPVLMTSHCNLPEGFARGAAMECRTDAGEIAADLADFLGLPDSDLCEMGRRGRNLVEDRFSWQTVARRMLATYRWVLGGGQKPDEIIS